MVMQDGVELDDMKVANYHAADLFEGETLGSTTPELAWCETHAAFQHHSEAEYILYCGFSDKTSGEHYDVQKHYREPIPEKIRRVLDAARKAGYSYVCFYLG